MKKLLIFLLIGMFLISFVAAEVQTLKEVKQGDCITLRQKYANSTYANVTTITYPNETEIRTDYAMSGSGGVWYYEFCDTEQLGDYEYCPITDVDGVDTFVCLDFKSTPNGQGGTANIVFFVFLVVLFYGINFFGFFGKNEIMTILGGMALIFLGIYIINNGVIIFRDDLTNYLGYVTIAWGFISAMWAVFELMQDL